MKQVVLTNLIDGRLIVGLMVVSILLYVSQTSKPEFPIFHLIKKIGNIILFVGLLISIDDILHFSPLAILSLIISGVTIMIVFADHLKNRKYSLMNIHFKNNRLNNLLTTIETERKSHV